MLEHQNIFAFNIYLPLWCWFFRRAMTLAMCLITWSMSSLNCCWLSCKWRRITLTLVQVFKTVGILSTVPSWKLSMARRSFHGYFILFYFTILHQIHFCHLLFDTLFIGKFLLCCRLNVSSFLMSKTTTSALSILMSHWLQS